MKIEDAARILKESMYEPEQFPGLVYRMERDMIMGYFSSLFILLSITVLWLSDSFLFYLCNH